ncbi:LysM peptidoglycan-binding domain-containing M23 family metallopeptidase [Streptomyces sp. NPDC004610]|uniref:LysM peptidoglycan-binding domain-containing M23 family metallopeptidase n=1 Tax=unclassified Streptomyces TaxID=2593676 RepID=UPI0033AA09EF
MPAKGKHRRPRSLRFTRSLAVAGTGGAALALPLMGAAGAHAAPGQSVPQKPVEAVTAAPNAVPQQTVTRIADQKSAAPQTSTRTYSVKVGDYLSKIADEQDVSGGWQTLYADNREAVGGDPSLIHPGLKLTLGGKASGGSTEQPAKTERTEKTDETPATEPSGSSSDASDETGTRSSSSGASDTAAQAPASSSGASLPVASGGVGTAYRQSGSMWSSGYHTGVDFSVPTGTSLKAVGAGTVVSAGWGGAYGNEVVIRLADGYYAQYAHLSSLSVSQGQSVSAGQQIGLSGATGNVTGPHLHFEIRTGPGYGSDVDPIAYLRGKGLSLG